MKTIEYDNPMIVHDVHHDFVCPKENFGINSKMFRSDAPNRVGVSKDAPNRVEIKNIHKCEFDSWSPNESMR